MNVIGKVISALHWIKHLNQIIESFTADSNKICSTSFINTIYVTIIIWINRFHFPSPIFRK